VTARIHGLGRGIAPVPPIIIRWNLVYILMRVNIVPFESVPAIVKREVLSTAQSTFDADVTVRDRHSLPDAAYNSRRDQYNGEELAIEVERIGNAPTNLGLTTRDLYIPPDESILDVLKSNFDCVFSASFSDGSGGMCSTYRLETNNRSVFKSRVRKETVKQIGYMQGMEYCENSLCVLSHTPTVKELDNQTDTMCDSCRGIFKRITEPADSSNDLQSHATGASKSTDTKIFDPDAGE
jgi:predicted Zn-dependent protease